MPSTSSPTDRISAAIAHLRSLSQLSIQDGWRYWDGDLPLTTALDPQTWQQWTVGEVNAKDHHAWTKGRNVRWFSRHIQVPHDLNGFPLTGLCLRLGLLWWSEDTQVYVNGQLVQEGDLFDCAPRLLLSPAVQPGDQCAIALRLVSPIHDDGALMKSICHYETTNAIDLPEPAFIANELAVLQSFLEKFDPEKLAAMATAIAQLHWPSLNTSAASASFIRSLTTLRHTLLPLAAPLKQRHITLVGHAHLDMAWLWTVAETWNAAERTFRSALALQQEFPELTFAHSTPALYEWMEQHRPDVFAQIQAQVQAGKWEIVAGFWIEPELNLISGESMARQILYGQRYVQEKFGEICAIAWVPDTFGFTWQLPQLLKQGGVECFITQKLRWNDTTKFPHDLFQWQAPDGTQILSLMSAPIGEAIDPVKMAAFAWDFEQKTGLHTSHWLPGVGDHGGGPTRDMLEVARRWQQSPFFPELEFGTVAGYLQNISDRGTAIGKATQNPTLGLASLPDANTHGSDMASLPIWNSDLYLEFHRGCYTTHADQKQQNRWAENQLYQAELWTSLASIVTGVPYSKTLLEAIWKKTLFNQFHDILPGSSIQPVFVDANEAWHEVYKDTEVWLDDHQNQIARWIDTPQPPRSDATLVVVFNSTAWERTEIAKIHFLGLSFEENQAWQICDSTGQALSPQSFTRNDYGFDSISFLVTNVPACGYQIYWIYRIESSVDSVQDAAYGLENEHLQVYIDSKTGDLSRIYDKLNQREVLSGAGNQLQAFADAGQYWDAWNIDPNYAQYPLPPTELQSIQWLERSEVRSRVRVIRTLRQSTFQQDYVLETGSPLLKIETRVDWQERHILVKAAFPLTLEADFATYEIPCGAIQRTTKPQTETEKAQWEVPAMHWADLSDGEYGVSLLNNCKYGYDANPNQLRLTLLRGTEWPDPDADRGLHFFTYAIYPHSGDWTTAQTVQLGYALNIPLCAYRLYDVAASPAKTLPTAGSFLSLGAENLVLMAFKQAEDATDEWILRCYECHGEPAQLRLHSDIFEIQSLHAIDLLERPVADQRIEGQTAVVHPWQIASFKLKLSTKSRRF